MHLEVKLYQISEIVGVNVREASEWKHRSWYKYY